MDKKKHTAIILSAGTGSRMKSNMPKQYMELLGRPVIYYSIKAFEDSPVDEIVIVCSADYIEYFRHSIIEKYGFKKVKAIVQGGKERYNSVYEGLKAANGTDYVLIHDGARPLVDNEIIVRSMHTVEKEKACVAGMPVKDTIKVSDELGYSANTPDRKSLWQIQTPQCFEYDLLAQSYDKLFSDMSYGKSVPAITDDAMIVEYGSDTKVKLIEGSYENIKVTTPEDMGIAELFCSLLHICFKAKESAGGGIRTHAPLRTNGFQDRLVMTTSIPLRVTINT